MKIYSIALSPHDHNAYDGVFHDQQERYTRRKHNIYPNQEDIRPMIGFYFDYYNPSDHEIFAFTITQGGLELLPRNLIDDDFLKFKPTKLWDYYRKGNVYYIDHHQSHATYAYLSSGYTESDILAIDGRGINFKCIFVNRDGDIIDLSDKVSIGSLWNYFAKLLGFGNLGAGKIMGLAAYGEYSETMQSIIDYYCDNNFKFPDGHIELACELKLADVAYTLQHATIELINEHVLPLKTCDNICIAGGVAYNGYMNEEFTKHYKNVYVPPAPGDEGQSLGTYMHADYILNDNVHVPSVYGGKEYDYVGDEKVNLTEVAQAIANGKIVGWFQGKSESGNRALGNRSILADPRNPNIKDIINSTIKFREDYRPFAPTVLEEHYQEYFDTSQPSPYMSRIVPVKTDKIPGVTHIDNTARIQTLNREQNPRYYDLINEFYKITGIPILLNTSFNCQEPMVETPEEAINTFNKTQLDLLVINDYILRKMG